MIEKIVDNWVLDEKDDLLRLAKLTVVVFLLMIILLLLPVWILPYLIYKKWTSK